LAWTTEKRYKRYEDWTQEELEALGGRENVNSVAHCATRLRVMVKDEGKIDKNTVENLEKVQGAFFNSGQYQIIFGTGITFSLPPIASMTFFAISVLFICKNLLIKIL